MLQYVSHAISSRSRVHHHGSCGSERTKVNARSLGHGRSHEIQGGTETSVRPHRRGHMLYRGLDAPSNVTNRPGGGLERSDTCDPSTSIFIHLQVALSGRCRDQLRPDSLETAGYGKRCSIGCVSACSILISALSSLKPSTYTHQLRVGDAANRAAAVMSDGTR